MGDRYLKKIKTVIRLLGEANPDIESLEVRNFLYGIKVTRSRGVTKSVEQRVEEPLFSNPEKPPYQEVKSPMVGTYYRNEKKTRKPLVREGGRVKAGQVLCYIEALKLMNPVLSDYEGIVRTVCVRKNRQPVEFGQILFEIEETKEQ